MTLGPGGWLAALDVDGTILHEDGSVTVPQALRPYLGGLEVLKPLG